MKLGPFEINDIYCGQSEELLAQLPDGCIDLTVTSPPYDGLRDYNGFTLDWREIIRQLYRVTKPGGVVVWVVADETKDGGESLTSFEHALYARACGFKQETMVYEQAGTGAKGSNYFYWQSFEFMFVWVKGERPRTSNLIEDVKNINGGSITSGERRKQNGQKKVTLPRKVKEYGRRTNIWCPRRDANDLHPAPFPESLARDHILSWSNPGDICLDPFVGSGTTAKMAMQNGRHYLGFDVSEEYCELSRKRVSYANPPLLVVG